MNRFNLLHTLLVLWGVCLFKLPITIGQSNEDSLGYYSLQESIDFRKIEKLEEANFSALSAIEFFEKKQNWNLWVDSYESIYQNARSTDAAPDLIWAIEQFAKAEKKIKTDPEISDQVRSKIYGRTATLYHNLGQYWEAITYYKKAFTPAENAGDDLFLLKLYGNAGVALWAIGDDESARNFHEKALEMAYKIEDEYLILRITTNLANTWRTIDPIKSIPFYQKALQLDPTDSQANMLLSKAYLEGPKDGVNALKTAQKAWTLAKEDYMKSDALHQLGRVSFFQKKYNKAIAYYNKAIPFSVKSYGKNHPESVKIHFYRGNAFLEKNDFESSLSAYNQVLNLLLPLFTPTSIGDHPTEENFTNTSLWILEALNGKSNAYLKKYELDGQIENLENALTLAELGIFYLQKIKLRYGDDESKYQMNNNYFSMCGKAMEVAFDLKKITGNDQYLKNAFRVGAQTKAIVLSETLYRKELKNLSGIPDSVLNLERKIHGKIAHWEKKIFEKKDSLSLGKQKDSLFFAKRELENLEHQVEEFFPNYAKAKFNYSQQSIQDIQKEISDSTALIEYFLTEESIFSFLITTDTFWAKIQPRPINFDRKIESFLRTISDWNYVKDSSFIASQLFLENSSWLFQTLLAEPLQLVDAKKLIIIPDELLSPIPFEVLLSKPYQGDWIDRDVPYLLKKYAISYRFSSAFSPVADKSSMDNWGGFGLEFKGSTQEDYLKKEEDLFALRNNGKLPHAGDEISNIASFFDGSKWLNEKATRENFLKNAEEFEILHLATHAIVNQKDPLRSKIIFSKSIIDDDPAVYAHEIYSMQLKAGLTVLSACSSGTGTWKRGEGMMSLARAFTYAGCPSTVMSLWNVSDHSTSILMIDFYKNLKASQAKDEALQASKINYLQSISAEYSKPIYWASFVVVGDVSPIVNTRSSSRFSLWKLSFILFFSILLGYFIFSKIR